MAKKTREELEDAFTAKLKAEWGRDDIIIDWTTHHRTAPAHLRAGDPSTCTRFVDIQLYREKEGYRKFALLLYRSLKDYLRKRVHFYIFRDQGSPQIVCDVYPTTLVQIH